MFCHGLLCWVVGFISFFMIVVLIRGMFVFLAAASCFIFN